MEPSWQKLAVVKVNATTGPWSVGRVYVPGSRLLRFPVVDKDDQDKSASTSWSPVKGINCGPDGAISTPVKSSLLTNGALYGALIGKLGGSSADVPDSSQPTTPYANKRVFAVGSHCIISISSTEGGPLYFTMNDSPDGFPSHSGELNVLIEQYAT